MTPDPRSAARTTRRDATIIADFIGGAALMLILFAGLSIAAL